MGAYLRLLGALAQNLVRRVGEDLADCAAGCKRGLDYKLRSFRLRYDDVGPGGSQDWETQPEQLAALVESIRNKPWFCEELDRRSAQDLVHDGGAGCFLIRPSASTKSLTLTLWYRHRAYNILIRQREDGMLALGSKKNQEMTFNSVNEMVRYYEREPLILYSGGEMTGKTRLKAPPPGLTRGKSASVSNNSQTTDPSAGSDSRRSSSLTGPQRPSPTIPQGSPEVRGRGVSSKTVPPRHFDASPSLGIRRGSDISKSGAIKGMPHRADSSRSFTSGNVDSPPSPEARRFSVNMPLPEDIEEVEIPPAVSARIFPSHLPGNRPPSAKPESRDEVKPPVTVSDPEDVHDVEIPPAVSERILPFCLSGVKSSSTVLESSDEIEDPPVALSPTLSSRDNNISFDSPSNDVRRHSLAELSSEKTIKDWDPKIIPPAALVSRNGQVGSNLEVRGASSKTELEDIEKVHSSKGSLSSGSSDVPFNFSSTEIRKGTTNLAGESAENHHSSISVSRTLSSGCVEQPISPSISTRLTVSTPNMERSRGFPLLNGPRRLSCETLADKLNRSQAPAVAPRPTQPRVPFEEIRSRSTPSYIKGISSKKSPFFNRPLPPIPTVHKKVIPSLSLSVTNGSCPESTCL